MEQESESNKRPFKLRFIYLLLLLVIGVGVYQFAILFLYGGQVPAGWKTSLSTAYSDAQEGKLILVYFTTKTCLPCVQLKRTTLRDEVVAELINKRFSPLYLDMDEIMGGSPEFTLFQRSMVYGYPAMRIIDSKGKLLQSSEGYLNTEQMLKFLNDGLAKKKAISGA